MKREKFDDFCDGNFIQDEFAEKMWAFIKDEKCTKLDMSEDGKVTVEIQLTD